MHETCCIVVIVFGKGEGEEGGGKGWLEKVVKEVVR